MDRAPQPSRGRATSSSSPLTHVGRSAHPSSPEAAPRVAYDWSPDSKYLVTANDDGTMRVFRADSGVEYGEPLGGPAPKGSTDTNTGDPPAGALPRDVEWSPDGSVIAAAMGDGSLRLYDTNDAKADGPASLDGPGPLWRGEVER